MSRGVLFLVLLGNAFFEAVGEPAHHALGFFAFAAKAIETVPIEVRTDRWGGDAIDF